MADKVDINLEINAQKVIEVLNNINRLADTASGKANLLKKSLMDLSRATGDAPEKLLKQLQALQGQVIGGEQFEAFKTKKFGVDVTEDVFQETAALLEADKALNKYASADSKAAAANKNFDGSIKQVNPGLKEQAIRIQALATELNKLKSPTQGRNALGQFTTAAPPSFTNQFKSLSTYQEQLKLVEQTISNLQKKTNLPFKDIGRELGKSFPELLKVTKLVEVAVENLTKANQGLSSSFRTEAETIALVNRKLTELQAKGRLNLKGSNADIVNNLKSVIKEVSAATGTQYKDVANGLKDIQVPAAQVDAALKGVNAELTRGTKSAQGFRHNIDVIRTALGTLVAVGIFTFINAIQKSFADASKAARELEDSLFRLGNVERILSKGGIEVSMKGLKEGIQEIKKLFPIFSDEDITQLVAQISISTKELGLTEKQIIDLSKAVAILNIRSTEEETASQTAQKVISSLITDNARGIASLGLSFNETAMEAEGMAMGIITAKKSLSDLTNEEKAQIKFNILLKNTGGELQNVSDYLDTNTAKIKENSAAWHDFLTTIGQTINNAIPDVTGLIEKLQKAAELGNLDKLIRQTGKTNIGLGSDAQLLKVQAKLFLGVKLTTKEYEHLKEVLSSLPDDQILKLFPDPSKIKDRFTKELVESLVEVKDTITGVPDLDIDVDAKGLDELDQKLEEISIDAEQAREDLDILLSQKQEDLEIKYQLKIEDIDTEYIQKGEDAARDYGQKLVDINQDAQQKIEDAKRKARDDEEKAEAEFLLKMKELRNDFILDLEDALHERDARQVLRLIKEYNNDRQKLIDKKALDDRFRRESLQADLQNIEIERQRKIESAGIEYQRKLQQLAQAKARELEELNIWKAREEQELQKWYVREQEEIDRHTRQKIERLLAGYIEEGKIHEEQQSKIHGILNKWFGKNRGLVDGLVNYTALKFAEMAAAAGAMLGAFAGFAFNPLTSAAGVNNPYISPSFQGLPSTPRTSGGSGGGIPRYAKGGQFVTTKPETIMVGEGGEPELVQVTPLSKLSSMQGRTPLNGADGLNGRNGQMKLAVDLNLSPDLEARVVDKAMDGTADVVARINRSK